MKYQRIVAPLLVSGATGLLVGCGSTSVTPAPKTTAAEASPSTTLARVPGSWYFKTGATAYRVEWGANVPAGAPGLTTLLHTGMGLSVAPGGQFFLGSSDKATVIYTSDGRSLRSYPSADQFVWGSDGAHLCRMRTVAGRLTASILAAPDFAPVSEEVGLPAVHGGTAMLEACNAGTQRLLVSVNATFASTTASLLVDAKTGSVIRRATYSEGTVLHVSASLTRIAANCAQPGCTSHLFDATSGASLLDLPGRQIRAISADDQEIVTVSVPPATHGGGPPELSIDDRMVATDNVVWRASGNFQGAIPGPPGLGFAVGLGPVNGAIAFDILYVHQDGAVSTVAHQSALL